MLAIWIYHKESVKCWLSSEKVKDFDLIREEINFYVRLQIIYGKKESSTLETVKKEKNCASFAIILQTVKVTATEFW